MIFYHVANSVIVFWLVPCIALIVLLHFGRYSVARSPQSCHWLLCFLSLLVLTLSVVSPIFPKLEIVVAKNLYIYNFSEFLSQPTVFNLNLGRILLYSFFSVYVFVSVFMLVEWLKMYESSKKLVRHSYKVRDGAIFEKLLKGRKIQLLESKKIHVPVVWGVRSPRIILPEHWRTWDQARLHRVLLHEISHVDRKDWLTKNAFFVLRAIFWFLPPLWKITKRISDYAELSCDDSVIEQTDDRADYARDILDFSTHLKIQSAFVSVSSGVLSDRMFMILSGGRARENISWIQKLFRIFTLTVLLIPCYMFSIKPSPYVFPTLPVIKLNISQEKPVLTRSMESPSPPVSFENSYEELVLYRRQKSISSLVETKIYKDDLAIKLGGIDKSISPSVSIEGYVPTKLVKPEYPLRAQLRNVEARITVEFDLDQFGFARNFRFQPHEKLVYFEAAIKKALVESQFRPVSVNGVNVKVNGVKEVFIFKLASK